jgi:hypothetical protein
MKINSIPRKFMGLTFLVLLGLAGASGLSAQVTPQDLLTLPRLSPSSRLALSPGGDFIAYSVDRFLVGSTMSPGESLQGGKRPPEKTSELWIMDLRTKQSKKICCSDGAAINPSWSSGGKYLAFYRSKKYPMWWTEEGSRPFLENAFVAVWNREADTLEDLTFLTGTLARNAFAVPAMWLPSDRSLMVFTRGSSDHGSYESRDPAAIRTGPGKLPTQDPTPAIRVLSTEPGLPASECSAESNNGQE